MSGRKHCSGSAPESGRSLRLPISTGSRIRLISDPPQARDNLAPAARRCSQIAHTGSANATLAFVGDGQILVWRVSFDEICCHGLLWRLLADWGAERVEGGFDDRVLNGADALFEEAWGKRTELGGKVTFFPLRDHCADVAAVVEALIALPTIRGRLDGLAGRSLTAVDLARLAALAFLHDIGKAAAGFWWKGQPESVQLSLPKPVALGHTREVLALLGSWGRQQLPKLARINTWQDDWNYLLAAVSHHGDPVMLPDQLVDLGGDVMRRVWEPLGAYRPLVAAGELLDLAARHFPLAFNADAPPLPEAPRLVHAFAGLVSLADWIGSNTETWAFPYDAHERAEIADRMIFARQRAPHVLRKMGLDVEAARADLAARKLNLETTFGFPPNEAQTAMNALDLGPIVVLEAETGSGKTEAALWRFKTLFEAGEVDSLLFTLPTRVAAVSLEHRVRAFVERLFPEESLQPAVLLAVPSYWLPRPHGDEPFFRAIWWPPCVSSQECL